MGLGRGEECLPQAGYLLAQDTYTLGWQVVQGEDEAPVEVTLPRQGLVVDVCLLHVLLYPQ